MRRINGIDRLVIGFLCRSQFAAGGIPCLLRSVEFPLALVRLQLRSRVRIAQVQHILLRKFCVITCLLQIAPGDTSAILALTQGITALFDRGLRLRKARCEQQHNPCPSP